MQTSMHRSVTASGYTFVFRLLGVLFAERKQSERRSERERLQFLSCGFSASMNDDTPHAQQKLPQCKRRTTKQLLHLRDRVKTSDSGRRGWPRVKINTNDSHTVRVRPFACKFRSAVAVEHQDDTIREDGIQDDSLSCAQRTQHEAGLLLLPESQATRDRFVVTITLHCSCTLQRHPRDALMSNSSPDRPLTGRGRAGD